MALHLDSAAREEAASIWRVVNPMLSDRRSKAFYLTHNLIDLRFIPVGLCSK
ncbi:hypothetical protein CEV33_0090 [Brucella grignonensis]|uniref:Uncharacterized protein n=1 Tax=Brucella grignonensis TaxID=94627 RepID=A0A256FMQ9_9HYPH|nr:hypothetical protein CEV33_0090 [Brucella grignonensis]